uniref:Uncharacterized protein n=1 Tax=Betaphycus gelatinus TaxID=1191690 RepID=A0A8E7UE89_9FLOR|nr:hypothetical protein [Betaphycus gelatinus]
MLISLFPIAFFNEYIISPKIWLHYIQYNKKIVSLFSYLSYFYYINFSYVICINLIFTIMIMRLYCQFTTILTNLHYMFFYCLVITVIYPNHSITNINIKKLLIRINYKTLHMLLCKIINLIYKTYYSFLVDKLFIKIILIPITCFLCLKMLFLTTKYEHIITYIVNISQYCKIVTSVHIGFLITISSQVLLLFTQKISYLIISIQLRNMNMNFIKQHIKSYYSLLKDFLKFSDSRIKIISSIICIKQIEYSKFIFINL